MHNVLEKIDGRVLGARLQNARRARQRTQQQVADDMEMSRTTIVAIEKGERRVTPEEMLRFSQLYGRPLSELLRLAIPDADFVPQFRQKWRDEFEDDPELESVSYELQRFAEDYVELETIHEVKRVEKDIPQYNFDKSNPEQAAEEIATAERNRLGIGDGPISNLRERLEMDVGLRVFYYGMPSSIAGIFAYSEKLGGCIGINDKHPRDRRNWSLAHEFGHFLTSRFQTEVTFLKRRRKNSVNERFADGFAENFLMPASGLNRRFTEISRASQGITMAEICHLADWYQVSVQALVLRLENLKRIQLGTWDDLSMSGFKPREAQRLLGIDTNPAHIENLPRWYIKLAVSAYSSGQISEGQLARFLRTNRVTARSIVERLTSDFKQSEDRFVNVTIDYSQEIAGGSRF